MGDTRSLDYGSYSMGFITITHFVGVVILILEFRNFDNPK